MGEHRALVREYLRGVTLPFESIAGVIVRERLASEREPALVSSVLVLWACAACGREARAAVPVAASLSLFERSLELHAELTEDGAIGHWGLGQGLNAGDALFAIAFRTLAEDVTEARPRLAAAQLVARAVLEAIEGRNTAITAAALVAGALIAGATPKTQQCFASAGEYIAQAATTRNPAEARRLADTALGAIETCEIDPQHRASLEALLADVTAKIGQA